MDLKKIFKKDYSSKIEILFYNIYNDHDNNDGKGELNYG